MPRAGSAKPENALEFSSVAYCGDFSAGQWVEAPIAAADTASGKIPVVIKNLKPGSQAVLSQIRFQLAK